MGVGIQDGYVLVWLGQSVDVEVSTQICETGEKIINQSIPNAVIVPVTKKQVSSSAFYIIIGSFNARSDAQSAVDSYHQMGYPNATVIESQGRVRVAIDVFKTQDLADRSLERYRTKFQGAWVFSEK
jgi:cell division septation protein DedD